ncbi:DNA-binding transcriptional LysR family regulator [Lentzea atacamensis]|uniref:DNA-binding transcriptional LysR family regulator n=1 Tax=Lentzea atacamensis TaxID=531938 RepID=A0ABX9E926_9PSEU|nr:LysR family transcriptional regulator [Lentzea atacamensis]RAS64679.1 DNA-binding transcriptional LysR family regulator [Lentzea atacamensis]
MDVDTRLLRYFAAIAEEGNLTRAAHRLFVSQPSLTKQLKHLESQLGVRLFTRSSTGMTLTEAGHTLAARVPPVLADWDTAVRDTRSAARVLRVGFLAGAANEATPDIVAAFARRRPDWRVDLRQASWTDATAGLASAEVPVALLRLPFPGQDAFGVRSLFTEPRCVALSSAHPLAHRDEIVDCVPVTGISPSEVGVAWLPDAGEAAAEFVRCCLDVTQSRRTGCGTR